MQLIGYTAMSMDGRIAGAGDGMAFLETIDAEGESDGAWDEFIASIDAPEPAERRFELEQVRHYGTHGARLHWRPLR